MQHTGKYILSVGLAALLVSVICEFSDKKSTSGALTRMVCGLFLAFTVINPLADLNFDILEAFSGTYDQNAASAVAAGTAMAEDSLQQIIKQETEAYILDKAKSYNADLQVDVSIGQGAVPAPTSVQIMGEVSVNTRRELEKMLEQELGISKENQQWIE